MSQLLSKTAVSCLDAKDSQEILQEYLNTQPAMVLSHTQSLQKQPAGTGAGDHLIQPR